MAVHLVHPKHTANDWFNAGHPALTMLCGLVQETWTADEYGYFAEAWEHRMDDVNCEECILLKLAHYAGTP